MSTPLSTSSFDSPSSETRAPANSTAAKTGTRWPAWMREPLLHFIVIGGLLFAVDHFLVSREGDPHTIVVGPAVDQEAVKVFEDSRGRAPNKEELEALHRVWLDNEVLYREGLAMEMDKGDDAIRDRVIFKALSVVDANVKLPPVSEKVLRDWFESHREKYDEPARYDFLEAALSGETSESAVRAFVDSLNSGTPGDAQAGLRVFKGRPHSNLVQSYGPDFPKELEASPIGTWRAMKTRDGWRAIQLESIAPAKPAGFEAMRGPVLQDWKDAIASEQRTAAVRALARKYKVIFESVPEGHAE